MHHTPARESSVRPPRTRALLLILAAVVLALLVSVLTTTSAIPAFAGTPRPSIVLVHGAFSGPSAWDEVAAGLHKDGYTTVAPALTLSGLAADVATVRAALDATPGPKILVGHSYGGFVVSNAASGRADVVGLVFTAAFLPDDGDTIVGPGTGYAPASFLAPGHLVIGQNGVATLTAANYREDFAQDLNPKLAASMAAAQTPTSLSILFTPFGPPAWRDLPSW